VEDADWGTVANDQGIVDVLEPVMNERRLIVRPSVVEQDFDGAKYVNGKRGAEFSPRPPERAGAGDKSRPRPRIRPRTPASSLSCQPSPTSKFAVSVVNGVVSFGGR
jgi:hypothetical protein